MGKKGSKKQGKSSPGGGGDDDKREQPLQAVLLAGDSFGSDGFRPLSLDRPKVLCPLNNVAMIDYAMDYLAGAGVAELFVVCSSDQVEEHVLQHEKDAPSQTSMRVEVIKDEYFNNAGDALRDLDKKGLVQSDPFLLLSGDVVTNVDLTSAMEAHKERHKKDSTAIMTLVLKEIGAVPTGSRQVTSIRPNTDDLLLGIDPSQQNRILFYDSGTCSKTAKIPCSFLTTNQEIELRSDLLDCGIDICSPDVLARFSDNFDYGHIRQEFVANSVAEEEEGLQNRIFAHILKSNQRPNEYAARVHDFYVYASVSRDLLRRWCYPVVPDHNYNDYAKHYQYSMQRHYLYYETKNGRTRVGRSSKVSGPGMVGSSCFVGENCTIERCVVGNYCHVAARSVVKDSHLWDGVDIGEEATVIQSVLADGAVVKAGATVNRGCIIGAGCIVGENVTLQPFTRFSLKEEEEDDFGDDWASSSSDEESEETGKKTPKVKEDEGFASALDIVGKDGKGLVWKPLDGGDDDDDDDDEGLMSVQEKIRAQSIGYDVSSLVAQRSQLQEILPADNFSDADDSVTMGDGYDDYGSEVDFTVDATGVGSQQIIGRQEGVDVVKELKAICLEYEMASSIENLAIELNSYKFSQNATYSDCTTAAIIAILERMEITDDKPVIDKVKSFATALDHWAPLLQKMSISTEEEKAMIIALESCAVEESAIGRTLSKDMLFRFLLQTLHDKEIVSEEAFCEWAEEHKGESSSPRAELYTSQKVSDFIEWLQEASEDESDESDEDSD